VLDPRLLRVTIDLDGEKQVFENLAISAIGTKHTSALQNFAEIRIANIDKPTRERLLTEGTPYRVARRQLKNSVLVEAGRESTGLVQVFEGDIMTVDVSPPPDIWVTIRALTGQFRKGEILALSQNASTKFSAIAQTTADILGVQLVFDTEDKDVANFSFSGTVEKLVDSLRLIASGVDTYIDDDRLVIRPRSGVAVSANTQVNIKTGLIRIPEFIDVGVRCTVLFDPQLRLGELIELTSEAYPATDGVYRIYKLGFNLANRDTPFYYIFEAARQDGIV